MKKKIFIVISNLAGGGAQRVVSTISQELSSYYHLYLILHDGTKVNYPYQGEIVDLKTPVAKNVFKKLLNFFLRILRLISIKRNLRPHTVISFMEGSNFINLLSGKQGKRVVSVRNYKPKLAKSLIGKLNVFMIQHCYKKSDLIVAVSKGIKANLSGDFKFDEKKISVIYNPCNQSYIERKAAEEIDASYKTLFDQPVLITVGSLMEQKGQWHLIRAFKIIKEAVPDMKLFIVGEGGLRVYLEQLAADLGLKDEVILAGYQTNPFQFMSRSSIFALPSLFEGFPNVLLEAMGCSLPVIASDCTAGPREILAPEADYLFKTEQLEFGQYGMLVPVCSGVFHSGDEPLSREEKILADAVITLYNDNELKELYKKRSLERIKDFTSPKIVQEWVELIEG